jgi:EmrB/QacA subfamily drug resistance transporter
MVESKNHSATAQQTVASTHTQQSQVGQEAVQAQDRIPGNLIGSIVATGIMAFIGILTETLMNVLFPVLMEEFGIGTSLVQWLTTAYLLVVSLTVPLSSYFKRKFTLKSQFIAAIALCIAGAVVAIIAPNFWILLCARVLQGIGTGIALPLMMNIILEQSPKSKLGALMGAGNLVIAAAPALGPTVGGIAGTFMNWRWIFVIVVPILLLALVLGLKCIQQTVPTEEVHLNVLHVLCIAVGFVSLIFALDKGGAAIASIAAGESGATGTLVLAGGLLVVGIAALVVFGVLSKRAFSPLIRLGVLRSVTLRWHLLGYALIPVVTIGLGYTIPNMAQLGYHASVLTAGLIVLPGALTGAFLAPVGGMMLDKFGPGRPIAGALVVVLAGIVSLTVVAPMGSLVKIGIGYFVYMVGMSLVFSNIMTSGLIGIPQELRSDANALFNTFQQLGGAAGTTMMSVFFAIGQAGTDSGTDAFAAGTVHGAYCGLIAACVVIVVVILSVSRAFIWRKQHASR